MLLVNNVPTIHPAGAFELDALAATLIAQTLEGPYATLREHVDELAMNRVQPLKAQWSLLHILQSMEILIAITGEGRAHTLMLL